MPEDSFVQNIRGVASLVGDDVNKVHGTEDMQEGVDGDFEDDLELDMSEEDLIQLRDEWEQKSNGYLPKIKTRQNRNRTYLRGVQRNMITQDDRVVANNLIFEATATFVPEALAKNPEPVVFSDNTDEGKAASSDLKTMLQYHADVLCLRKKLGMMVWHWGIYFIGVVKHGWDEKSNEITTELRKPQNFILDPDGFIDEFGDFKGAFLGERIETSAKKLVEMFPEHATYITLKVNAKMGTRVVYTEWWTDEFCFSTYQEIVLDKHKNEFFNYSKDTEHPINHFAVPKMPYTFLSVFSLQEEPYDFTNLVEQNISNQDRINDRDEQISKNLSSANNSVVLSGVSFTSETAGQAVQSFYEEGFILVPDGNVEGAVKRIPANDLPSAIFTSQNNDKESLRSIYGTLGLSAQPQDENSTARGQILNTNHDSSRIGGGVGDALEQVADNIFNWWVQLYCVFYDEKHFAAVMGTGRAVEYTTLISSDMERKFVVSVAPNSMKPKDEVNEQNMAIELANAGWLDPINLFKRLDDADPMNTAKMVTLFRTNPQQYMQQFFPEMQPQQPMGAPQPGVPAQPGTPASTMSAPEASASLSQVPISTNAMPQ